MADENQDELYAKAVQVVVRDNKGSTSYLQRRLQIGYNHAARLIEQMEQNGVLSSPDHKGVRTVLGTAGPIPTITVDMDKPCAECGKGGAVDNGLCMGCTSKAMAGEVMISGTGNAVQRRVMEMKGTLAHDTKNSKKEGHSVAKSGFAKDQLKSFINRIERLEEEKAALAADIKEVFSEARGTGFDTKIMRQVIRLRKLDKADFQEQEAILDLYLTAMDMR